MYPVLFIDPGIELYSYHIALLLAVIIPLCVVFFTDRSLFLFSVILVSVMYAGARAGAELEALVFKGISPVFTFYGSLSFWWGMLAAITAAFPLSKRLNLNLLKTADRLIPPFCLGMIFIRLGCLLNGCCFGKPCPADFFLGINFPQMTRAGYVFPDTVLFPAQLYYMVFWIICLLLIRSLKRANKGPGFVTFITGLNFSLFSLVMLFVRYYASVYEFVLNALFSTLLLVITLYYIYKQKYFK